MSDLYQDFLNLKIPASGLASTEFALIMQNDPQAIMSRKELENMVREKMSEKVKLAERSDNCIAQGTCTFSKHRNSYIHGPGLPTHVVSNDAVHITCDNGKTYVDCGCLGSALIAVHNNFSLPHIKEVELAEAIKARVPCIERVKFLKTGSDACMQACRFARAHTGRTQIIWANYHGTSDIFISQETPGAGVPHMDSIKFADIHALAAYCKSKAFAQKPPAAVIWEPMILDNNKQVESDNRLIIAKCQEHGVVSIMDETVTGGRTPFFCCANYWQVDPDLVVFGKAIGDGVPLAILGGKAKILNNRDVFCSNTHSASLDAMLAGLDSMAMLTNDRIQTLWTMGGILIDKFNKLESSVKLYGVPTRFTWKGSPEDISRFWEGMADRGYWCSISMFPKMSWTQDIWDGFLTAAKDVVEHWGDIDMTGVETYKSWFRRYT